MEFDFSGFYHEVPVQGRFNDADLLGHINNAVIQEYFDLGRSSYLNQCLGVLPGENGEHLVIVSIKTDFIKQVLPGTRVKVLTRVYELGTKSLRMIQWMVEDGVNRPLTTSSSVMSGFNLISGTGMVIPGSWRECFDQMERGRLTRGTAQ